MPDPIQELLEAFKAAGVVLAISLLYGASIAGGIVVTPPGPAAGGSRGSRVQGVEGLEVYWVSVGFRGWGFNGSKGWNFFGFRLGVQGVSGLEVFAVSASVDPKH